MHNFVCTQLCFQAQEPQRDTWKVGSGWGTIERGALWAGLNIQGEMNLPRAGARTSSLSREVRVHSPRGPGLPSHVLPQPSASCWKPLLAESSPATSRSSDHLEL